MSNLGIVSNYLLSTYFTNKLIITNVIKHNFLFFFDNADANAGLCYINSFNYLYNFTNINTLEEIGNYHILSVLLVFIHLFIAYKIFNNWLYIYILATSLVWSYTALSWSFLWVWESIEIFLILVITTHSYMVHIYNFKSKNLMYLPIFSILIKINYFNDILFIHGFGLIYPYWVFYLYLNFNNIKEVTTGISYFILTLVSSFVMSIFYKLLLPTLVNSHIQLLMLYILIFLDTN